MEQGRARQAGRQDEELWEGEPPPSVHGGSEHCCECGSSQPSWLPSSGRLLPSQPMGLRMLDRSLREQTRQPGSGGIKGPAAASDPCSPITHVHHKQLKGDQAGDVKGQLNLGGGGVPEDVGVGQLLQAKGREGGGREGARKQRSVHAKGREQCSDCTERGLDCGGKHPSRGPMTAAGACSFVPTLCCVEGWPFTVSRTGCSA